MNNIFFIFRLHVYDSLYSHALAFSQVPSGIALIESVKQSSDVYVFIAIFAKCEKPFMVPVDPPRKTRKNKT